jgi:hypothetical protein
MVSPLARRLGRSSSCSAPEHPWDWSGGCNRFTDPKAFRSGRDMAAWIGLVPRQDSTGGKQKLGLLDAAARYSRQTSLKRYPTP